MPLSSRFRRLLRPRRRFAAWLALGLVLAGLAPQARAAAPPPQAEPVPDTLAQRLLACTACHGEQGRATPQGYFPRLAGKPAGYLFHQLQHFQAGRRPNTAMRLLLAHLDEAYLREIAGYFAGLSLPYPAPPAPPPGAGPQLVRGEALVARGDAARSLPACVACHGARLTGVQPAIPGLLGLPRDYLVGQLGAWQTGQRQAAAPDCMAQIARRLSPEDVAAVATWLAAQAPPDPAPPAAALPAPLPLACGSLAP